MHRLICALGAILVASFAFTGVVDAAEGSRSATNAPPVASDAARPADGDAPVLSRESAEFEYGPILSRDPATRARIKQLYRRQAGLATDALTQLAALNAKLHAETDPDLRFATNREIGTVKRDLEREHMELGLEIARLNGDTSRVAEYEKALDQLLHPEKYRPTPNPDAADAERMRQLERN